MSAMENIKLKQEIRSLKDREEILLIALRIIGKLQYPDEYSINQCNTANKAIVDYYEEKEIFTR